MDMLVIAKRGTQCPKEGKPREYISDAKAEAVPDTAYYLRLVAEGSLVESAPVAEKKKSTNKTEKEVQ